MHHPPVRPAKAEPDNATRPNYRPRDAYNTKALRWTSDMLCLWGLCANAKCRRARQCRGEPSDCMTQYEPIVPENAYEGALLLREFKEIGMSFGDACEECPDEVEAIYQWAMLVMSSADKASRA